MAETRGSRGAREAKDQAKERGEGAVDALDAEEARLAGGALAVERGDARQGMEEDPERPRGSRDLQQELIEARTENRRLHDRLDQLEAMLEARAVEPSGAAPPVPARGAQVKCPVGHVLVEHLHKEGSFRLHREGLVWNEAVGQVRPVPEAMVEGLLREEFFFQDERGNQHTRRRFRVYDPRRYTRFQPGEVGLDG